MSVAHYLTCRIEAVLDDAEERLLRAHALCGRHCLSAASGCNAAANSQWPPTLSVSHFAMNDKKLANSGKKIRTPPLMASRHTMRRTILKIGKWPSDTRCARSHTRSSAGPSFNEIPCSPYIRQRIQRCPRSWLEQRLCSTFRKQ